MTGAGLYAIDVDKITAVEPEGAARAQGGDGPVESGNPDRSTTHVKSTGMDQVPVVRFVWKSKPAVCDADRACVAARAKVWCAIRSHLSINNCDFKDVDVTHREVHGHGDGSTLQRRADAVVTGLPRGDGWVEHFAVPGGLDNIPRAELKPANEGRRGYYVVVGTGE